MHITVLFVEVIFISVYFANCNICFSLTLWVTWNADGVRRIRLLYVDGTSSVLKAIPAFCDMPFTVTLSDTRRLHKVFTVNDMMLLLH